jgi:hypothetical protein
VVQTTSQCLSNYTELAAGSWAAESVDQAQIYDDVVDSATYVTDPVWSEQLG